MVRNKEQWDEQRTKILLDVAQTPQVVLLEFGRSRKSILDRIGGMDPLVHPWYLYSSLLMDLFRKVMRWHVDYNIRH